MGKMSIINEVSASDFIREFHEYDRDDNFTNSALKSLYEYMVNLSDDCGEDINLDVVALCCEFSEYDNARTCISECGYSFEFETDDDEDEEESDARRETEALEYLINETNVIIINSISEDGIVINDF